eukprot:9690389-Alexandrium_andersonii.AAC.1
MDAPVAKRHTRPLGQGRPGPPPRFFYGSGALRPSWGGLASELDPSPAQCRVGLGPGLGRPS